MMKIYLDMDGVLADFFKGFANHFGKDHWKQIQNKEKSIQELQGTDFFNTLDTFPTTIELVNFVQTLVGDDWGICSSPLRGDRDNSAYWKRVWLTRHFIIRRWRTLSSLVEKNSMQWTRLMVHLMS